MKSIALLSVVAAGTVLGGEPVFYDKSPAIPPAPSLYQWFAGATAGYLFDNEEEMYTAHLGVDLPNQLGGWDQAIYLEVGYTELDGCFALGDIFDDTTQSGLTNAAAPGSKGFSRLCGDLEIIPVTLNYKLERQVTNSLNWYLGAGAGVAFLDLELTASGDDFSDSRDDDDTVFYAQAFTGLLYNVNPSFELYGGVRYIYFDEPDFSADGEDASWSDLESAFGWENTDWLAEIGARFNF